MPRDCTCGLLAAVEAENDALREEVRLLRAGAAVGWRPPHEWRLTGAEGAVMAALLARPEATKEQILACTNRDAANDEREIKIVDVFVCKLRAKIKPFGWRIDTVWGRGYAIAPADREQLLGGAVVCKRETAA